jgi:hypothetical protein
MFGDVLVDELPLTPERVYALIEEARAGGNGTSADRRDADAAA